MDITFASGKMQKLCNSASKLKGEYGPRMAKVIQRRLADLQAALCLDDMRLLPGRCHELTGNLAGQLALDLVHPERLLFEPNHDPKPQRADGGLDWKLVTMITILAIGDYH
jgi:plasmid maintenance system killer protein